MELVYERISIGSRTDKNMEVEEKVSEHGGYQTIGVTPKVRCYKVTKSRNNTRINMEMGQVQSTSS